MSTAEGQDEAWFAAWIDAVASGRSTMSQRSMRMVERHGGIDRAVAAARARDVHLVRLTDDQGRSLVAASRHPFTALC